MLKGYDALVEVSGEKPGQHCLSLQYINQLFSDNSAKTCHLDKTKIDQKLCLNTFYIEILQQPRTKE